MKEKNLKKDEQKNKKENIEDHKHTVVDKDLEKVVGGKPDYPPQREVH